jgi:hypothetical protein
MEEDDIDREDSFEMHLHKDMNHVYIYLKDETLAS